MKKVTVLLNYFASLSMATAAAALLDEVHQFASFIKLLGDTIPISFRDSLANSVSAAANLP